VKEKNDYFFQTEDGSPKACPENSGTEVFPLTHYNILDIQEQRIAEYTFE